MVSDDNSLLGVGIYSVPEAARLTGIRAPRLRRWIRGYEFPYRGRRQRSESVIDGELPVIDGKLAISFLDLQEARCINEFRSHGVGWKALREAHERAVIALRTPHPFSTGQFKSLGRKIMWDFANERGDPVLLELATSQTTFRDMLEPFLRGLEFANRSHPVRWFPLAGSKRVVLDPTR